MKEKRKRPDRRIGPRRKSVLVEDWKVAYKWLSVQLAAIVATLGTIYEAVPDVQKYLDPKIAHWLMVAGAVGVILGRIKAQK